MKVFFDAKSGEKILVCYEPDKKHPITMWVDSERYTYTLARFVRCQPALAAHCLAVLFPLA